MYRGEIWLTNLDLIFGAEITKSRPTVILNVDEVGVIPMRVIFPITTCKNYHSQASWLVMVESSKQNGLAKTSAVGAFQVRSLSLERFSHCIGETDSETLSAILTAIQIVLGL